MEKSLRKMTNAQLIVELSKVGDVTSGNKSALIVDHLHTVLVGTV